MPEVQDAQTVPRNRTYEPADDSAQRPHLLRLFIEQTLICQRIVESRAVALMLQKRRGLIWRSLIEYVHLILSSLFCLFMRENTRERAYTCILNCAELTRPITATTS